MHYLECLSLLNYLLDKLHAGQRQQVAVGTLTEVMTALLSVNKKLSKAFEDDPMLENQIQDIMGSLNTIKSTQGLVFLTDNMKEILVDGINDLKGSICLDAYHYFQIHDFEPTEQVIPLMRTVVEVALEKGVNEFYV